MLVLFCAGSAVLCFCIAFDFVVGSILIKSRRLSCRKAGYRMLCQVGVNSFWLVNHCPFAEEKLVDCECRCVECPAYRREHSCYCPAVLEWSCNSEERVIE